MHHHNINFPVFKIHNMIYVIIIVKSFLKWSKLACTLPHGFLCDHMWQSSQSLVTVNLLNTLGHYWLWFLSCVLNLQITSSCVSATSCSWTFTYSSPPLPKSYMFGFYKHLTYKEIKQCFFSYFMNTMSSKSTLIGGKWYGFLLC